jgi:hypothetical protein
MTDGTERSLGDEYASLDPEHGVFKREFDVDRYIAAALRCG